MKALSDKALRRVREFQGISPKRAQEGGYAQNQMRRLTDDGILALQVRDDGGNTTNWMNLDDEVVSALQQKLSGNLPQKEKAWEQPYSGSYGDEGRGASRRRVREFQNFETEGSRGRKMAQGSYLGNPRVIFDNGGGVTVQIWDGENSYSHHYDDPQEAALDVAAWIEGENTYDWEGNDEDAMFDPTADELRNGSYRIWMIGDDIPSDPGWDNMIDFFEMIKSRGKKMAQGKEHLGYKNYETWVLTLWLENDYNDYQYWRNKAMEAKAEDPESFIYTLSDELKEFYTDQAPDLQGVYADLLGFALDEIDWREVAESISQD